MQQKPSTRDRRFAELLREAIHFLASDIQAEQVWRHLRAHCVALLEGRGR